MAHRCYICCKDKEEKYRMDICSRLAPGQVVGDPLDSHINSGNYDSDMQIIRSRYLINSEVTLYLIGSPVTAYTDEDSKEAAEAEHRINMILNATLYKVKGNERCGLVGIVLPEMYDAIYGGGRVHINSETVNDEFSEVYNEICNESERKCVLVKYDDFIKEPDKYIDEAYDRAKMV